MIQTAIELALKAHDSQKRKGSEIPYIVHPMEVAVILAENGADHDVIVAGILHDTLEDTNITPQIIKERFGEKVARLVLATTEPNKDKDPVARKQSWKDRKFHAVKHILTAPNEVKLIVCADKLSNIRSIKKDYERVGDKLWNIFNAGYEEQKWYYHNMVVGLWDPRFARYEMFKEFNNHVKEIFGEVPEEMFLNKKLYEYDYKYYF